MISTIWTGQALEDEWRERARAALRRYEEARAATAAAQTERSQRLAPAPDGALAAALKAESAALREYTRVLKIFMDLVMHGKSPGEEPR